MPSDGRGADAAIWTPEVGAESMGTMPNSKCCPKQTAAAGGQAVFYVK